MHSAGALIASVCSGSLVLGSIPTDHFSVAAIGFVGARMGRPEFALGGGHPTARRASDSDSLLGEAGVDHAKRAVRQTAQVAATWLAIWLAPVLLLLATLGTGNVFTQIAVFFSQMAVVTFGGAYAVLAYVAQEAVHNYHWLQPGEMLDGLGMAETTPGPLIMVLQFVGFMAAFRESGMLPPIIAGTLGGLLATWVTFTPCFLWIFLGAPYIENLRGNKALTGALSAITAAIVGVILNLAIWFSIQTLFRQVVVLHAHGLSFEVPVLSSVEPWALGLSLAAAIAIFRFKAGMLQALAASGAAGIALYLAGAIR
jgi:chromate transporter